MKLPGGSLPITSRTSMPEPLSAAAWSSACSTTAPQNDQEYGTTIPTFIPQELCTARYLSSLCSSVDRPEEPNDRRDACHTTPAPSRAAGARPRRRSACGDNDKGTATPQTSPGTTTTSTATPPVPTGSPKASKKATLTMGTRNLVPLLKTRIRRFAPTQVEGHVRQDRRARRPDIVLGGPQPQPADPRHDAAEGRERRRRSRVGQKVDFVGLLTSAAVGADALGVTNSADKALLESQGAVRRCERRRREAALGRGPTGCSRRGRAAGRRRDRRRGSARPARWPETTEPPPPSTTRAPVPAPPRTDRRARPRARRSRPARQPGDPARAPGRPHPGPSRRADGVRLSADARRRLPEGRLARGAQPRARERPARLGARGPATALATARRARGRPLAARAASSGTKTASSAGSASRSAHPTRPRRRASTTSRTSSPAPTSARTTGAASSRSRAASRTCRKAGRAATGSRSTARRRRPGARRSRTAASTPREADLRYLMKTVPLGTVVDDPRLGRE